MATFAIGDVHGCLRTLKRLLDEIGFRRQRDALWFVGDLVGRGPASLDVLRFVADLQDRARLVLGNHELHLLACARGVGGSRRPPPCLAQILAAPDGLDLLSWLAQQPLLVHAEGWLMVHAGLLSQWSLKDAVDLAKEAEQALHGPDGQLVLAGYGDDAATHWAPSLAGMIRTQTILNAMTRLRVCTDDGRMDLGFTGSLTQVPAGCRPWFRVAERPAWHTPVVFGHWAALGFHSTEHFFSLDGGCVWGRKLVGLRLADRRVFSVSTHPDDRIRD